MTGSRITFMGAVPPWECDIVDHFTVAYYYQKLDHATDVVLGRAGFDPADPAAPTMVRCLTRFERELVKGDIYRIETVRLAADRLAHRLIDAATDTVCTRFDQCMSSPIPASGATPAGADTEPLPLDPPALPPPSARWLDTGVDVLGAEDCGLRGSATSHAYILRFSAAGEHLRDAIGITPAYVREHNVGFATFSFDARFAARAGPGTPVTVQSTLSHVGRTSLHIEHRLLDARDGTGIAALTQAGVHLDKARRRPSPMPAHIAAAARELFGTS